MNVLRSLSYFAVPATPRVLSTPSFRPLRRALRWIALALLAGTVASQAQTAYFSGSQTNLPTSIPHPSAIAVDQSGSVNNGSVFVADYSPYGNVYRFTHSGSTWSDGIPVTNLSNPFGMAVDASGNLWIADQGTHAVYKETLNPTTGTYTETAVLVGLTTNPWGLAFDSLGRLYVALHDDHSVKQYTETSGTWYLTHTFVVSGVTSVAGVAVDSNFNVYITSQDNSGVVVEEVYSGGSYIQSTIITQGANGTGVMTDIKVDAFGNLYIADQTNSRVLKESLENGSYVQSVLGSGFSSETGVAFDATGDIFVSDLNNDRAVEIQPNGVSLGTSAVGTQSTTTATIPWTFTAAGEIGTVKVLTQGVQNLDFKDAGGGSCVLNQNNAQGSTCTTNISFTPTQIGTRYGAAVIYNTSGQIIAKANLYGTGTGPLVNFTPYTRTTLPGTFTQPEGISGLGDGSLIIADSNNIYKETYAAGSYARSTIVASTDSILGQTLNSTQWVATDGAGNLYLADGGNGRIVKIPLETSGYSKVDASYVCHSGCGGNQIAVDTNGNVYTLSGATQVVQKFTPQPDGTYQYSVPYSAGLSNPWGIAVDASGDIFFTDANNDALYKLTPSGSTYSFATLVTGLHDPTGIALDTSGNIYVTEYGTNGHEDILKETFVSGTTYTQSTLFTSVNPVGVWVDNSGNVFASNTSGGAIYRYDTSDTPSIAFGSVNAAATSSTTTITLSNNGTSALSFDVPGTGHNPLVTGQFSLYTSGGSDCPQLSTTSTVTTLAAGSSCTLPISFAPTSAGSLSGSVAITDNSLNAASPTYATQTLSLTGTGVAPTPTVSGLNPAFGTTLGGTSVTITGTGLLTATAVTFGATAATSFTVNSDTSISAIAPAHAAGVIDVTVTNPTATSATSANDHFTYAAPPSVTGIAPSTGPTSGGTVVTLTGSGFTGATAVAFGTIAATSFTVTNDATITATAPAGANTTSGYVDITVTAPNGTSATSSADRFTYILSQPVGTTSTTQTVTITITTAGTLNHVSVVTQGAYNLDYTFVTGGTCVGGNTYAVSNTCTVEYKFTPTEPGIRSGGIALTDSSGNVLGSAYVSGIGIGPQLTFTSSAESLATLGTGFTQDFGVAVDASGNVYVGVYGEDAVKRIPAGCVTSSCVQTLGGTFSGAFGVAVDGLGNVLVAAGTTVFSIPPGCATSGCVSTVVTGFSDATGLAVDGAGNIYIGDFGTQAVREIPAGCSNISCVVTLGGGFGNLEGVAVDVSGNVYVAELSQSTIKRIPPGCTQSACVISLGGGLTGPRGVAVDSAGNVYVADPSATAIKFVPSNCTTSTCVSTLASYATGINAPFAVTVDQSGNVYIANSGSGSVLELPLATASTLTFPSTVVGATSSAQIVTLGNTGNASLTLSALTPTNAVFSSPAGNCTTTASLASGTTCSLGVEFAPTSAGSPLTGSVVVSDNSLNGNPAIQTISLSGTATPATPTVTAITPNSGRAAGGNTVTIAGTNFTNAATVHFGTTAATSVTFTDSGHLTAVSPAGSGVVAITVTTGAGTSATSAADLFSYLSTAAAISSKTLTANQTVTSFTPVTASGGSGTLGYSISPTLPTGLSFSTATGAITGTPIATIAAGSFTVTATDQNGAASSAAFSLTVLAPTLTLLPVTLTAPQVGVVYTQTLTASGGIAPYTWSVGTGSLPVGLSLSSTGVLSGTPTTGQASTFTLVARDSSPGSGPYSVSASYIVTVSPGNATLAFAAGTSTATYTYGQAPVTISATSASTAAVTYSVVSGPATINATSGVLTFTGAGAVVVNAAQVAGANYTAASAQVTLTVNPATPTLAFAAGTSTAIYTYGQAPVTISATSASSAAVTYSVVSGPATINATSGVLTFTGAGSVVVNAVQVASANYTAASAQVTLTVGPGTPTLAFAPGTSTATYTYGQSPVTIVATSASTAAVTYSVVSGPATINATSGVLTFTGAGSVVVNAVQVASANYTAASAQVTLTVGPGTPTLAFAPGTSTATYTYGQSPVTIVATSASTAAVTYSVVSGPATINATSGVLTFTGAGSVVVKAVQAANINYTTAFTQATLTVGQQATTITITASSTSITPVQPVTFTATVAPQNLGSPTGTVTFFDNGTAISSAIALTSGSAQLQLASLASGSHIITVAYSGDTNFLPATTSSTTTVPIAISVAPLTFTLNLSGTTSASIAPGGTASFPMMVNPTYVLFPGPVTFAVTGLPTGATYTVTPSSLPANSGPQQVTVTITVPAALGRLQQLFPWNKRGSLFVALLLPIFAFRRIRRATRALRFTLMLLAATLVTASLTACGTGTGYFNTPVQSYPVTFTATSGGITQSTVIHLQVQ